MNAAGQSRPVPFDAGKDQWEEGMVLNFFPCPVFTMLLTSGGPRCLIY